LRWLPSTTGRKTRRSKVLRHSGWPWRVVNTNELLVWAMRSRSWVMRNGGRVMVRAEAGVFGGPNQSWWADSCSAPMSGSMVITPWSRCDEQLSTLQKTRLALAYGSVFMTCSTSLPNGAIPVVGSPRPNTLPRCTSQRRRAGNTGRAPRPPWINASSTARSSMESSIWYRLDGGICQNEPPVSAATRRPRWGRIEVVPKPPPESTKDQPAATPDPARPGPLARSGRCQRALPRRARLYRRAPRRRDDPAAVPAAIQRLGEHLGRSAQRPTRRQPRRSPRLRLRPLPQRPHRLVPTPDELTARTTQASVRARAPQRRRL
jgi:hypothetical protein